MCSTVLHKKRCMHSNEKTHKCQRAGHLYVGTLAPGRQVTAGYPWTVTRFPPRRGPKNPGSFSRSSFENKNIIESMRILRPPDVIQTEYTYNRGRYGVYGGK